MIDLCWIDTETGGLDPITDALLEVACVRERASDGRMTSLRVKVAPYPSLRVTPEALAKNKIELASWAGAPEADALQSLVPLMDGAWMAGWHVHFDLAFLEAAFRRHPVLETPPPFWSSQTRCSTLSVEGVALALGYEFKNLDDLSEQLDIGYSLWRHTAMGDALRARQVYRALIRNDAIKKVDLVRKSDMRAASYREAARRLAAAARKRLT